MEIKRIDIKFDECKIIYKNRFRIASGKLPLKYIIVIFTQAGYMSDLPHYIYEGNIQMVYSLLNNKISHCIIKLNLTIKNIKGDIKNKRFYYFFFFYSI
jgi:hypothetical protein